MRNLKKLFAVVMTVAMLASLMVPALAADSFKYEAEAKKLTISASSGKFRYIL